MKRLLSLFLVCMMFVLSPITSAMAAEIPGEFSAMAPILDSIMRSCIELDSPYAATDPEYFWTVLGLMAANWGTEDPLNEIVDTELRVPRPKMQEYASAAFAEYSDLLALPEDFFVRYDDAWDAYFVTLNDASEECADLRNAYIQPNGNVDVYVVQVNTRGEVLYSMQASLTENIYSDAVVEPTFLYSVSRADISPVTIEERSRTIFMEGMGEEIFEVRFMGPGYSMWYPTDLMIPSYTVKSQIASFVPTNPNALPPVSLTIVPVSVTKENGDGLLNEAIYAHSDLDAALPEIFTAELDNGESYRTVECYLDGVVYRFCLIFGDDSAIAITATFPEEAMEGYGVRLNYIIRSIEMD